MTTKRILHYPGSKWSMAEWIISFFPEHTTYLEPYFGSGAILFNKKPSEIETVGDKSERITNLFSVIRDQSDRLAELIHYTPYSRAEYELSFQQSSDRIEDARRMLVRCWMARGSKTIHRTGWRHIIDPNSPRVTKQWNKLPNVILEAANRLKHVQIETQPALQLIKRYNRPYVLIYADPPYLRSTRTTVMYEHEMTELEHEEMLEVLDEHEGPVLLSGYANDLYDTRLRHWHRETKKVQAEGGVERTEVLWINPVAAEQLGQMSIFDVIGR